ncbi:MAG: flagellar protein FlgN [Calditrichaceae bacterium]
MSEIIQPKENPLYELLMHLLLEEISTCDYLVETLTEKQEAIVQNDLQKMNSLTGTEQIIINKTNALVSKRKELLADIYHKEGLIDMPVTMSKLIEQFEDKEKLEWTKLQKRLENSVLRIKRLNKENVTLLDTAITFVRDMIHILYNPNQETVLYKKDGSGMDKLGSRPIMDCNI